MSKSKVANVVNAYSISRKDSGYFIIQNTIQDNVVIKSKQVSEPDVLVICIANLERLIRKDLGL